MFTSNKSNAEDKSFHISMTISQGYITISGIIGLKLGKFFLILSSFFPESFNQFSHIQIWESPFLHFILIINILIFTMGPMKIMSHWHFSFHFFINDVEHLCFLIFTSWLYVFFCEFPFHILFSFHFWIWKDLSFRCIQKSYIMDNAKFWFSGK